VANAITVEMTAIPATSCGSRRQGSAMIADLARAFRQIAAAPSGGDQAETRHGEERRTELLEAAPLQPLRASGFFKRGGSQ
jgi:hypothetical protein